MSTLLYDLCARLFPILVRIGVGTNLGLLQIFFAPLPVTWSASSGPICRGRSANTIRLAPPRPCPL